MNDQSQGKPLMMLPPKAGACRICAQEHEEQLPHNRDSFYYQFWFSAQYGRSPTWADAMLHCDEKMRQRWVQMLRKAGVSEEKIGIKAECDHNQRHEDLISYVEGLRSEARAVQEAEFTEAMLDMALQIWQRLREHFLSLGSILEVPDASPGCNDDLMYAWSRDEHSLECEIFGTGAIEFFYFNRKTEEAWEEDTTFGQEFSAAILDKVAMFSEPSGIAEDAAIDAQLNLGNL